MTLEELHATQPGTTLYFAWIEPAPRGAPADLTARVEPVVASRAYPHLTTPTPRQWIVFDSAATETCVPIEYLHPTRDAARTALADLVGRACGRLIAGLESS